MSIADQILYCVILTAGVTGGVTALHPHAPRQKNFSHRILFALVYFGIPFGLLQFILFRLFVSE